MAMPEATITLDPWRQKSGGNKKAGRSQLLG
jgi:hypothetical protein